MALKDLSSKFDLVPGTEPVGNMEELMGPSFNLGPDSQFQQDSLLNQYTYQYGNSPSTVGPAELDLDGSPGALFDNGTDSTLHFTDSLLAQYTYMHGNSFTTVGPSELDLDGISGPQFSGYPAYDQEQQSLHVDSLLQQYQYAHGDSSTTVGPSDLDLNGNQGSQFNGNPSYDQQQQSLHVDSLLNIYNYSHGGSPGQGGPVPNESPYQDLDGVAGGNGYFGGIPNPSQGQGLQLNGQDIHVSLLSNPYNYSHGNSNASINGGIYDLNCVSRNSYSTNGPEGGFY